MAYCHHDVRQLLIFEVLALVVLIVLFTLVCTRINWGWINLFLEVSVFLLARPYD